MRSPATAASARFRGHGQPGTRFASVSPERAREKRSRTRLSPRQAALAWLQAQESTESPGDSTSASSSAWSPPDHERQISDDPGSRQEAAAHGAPMLPNAPAPQELDIPVLPLVRRRLRGKQSRPPAFGVAADARSPWTVREDVRVRWRRAWAKQHRAAYGAYAPAFLASAEAWRQLSESQICDLLRNPGSQLEGHVAAAGPYLSGNPRLAQDGKPLGFLLTWNGAWLQSLPELQAGWPPATQEATDALSDAVARTTAAQALLQEFWDEIEAPGREIGPARVTVSLELSTHSEAPRAHLHAFLSRTPDDSEGKRLGKRMHSAAFRGQSASHCSPTLPGKGNNRNDRATRQGHFYLQARKLGHVDCRTNFRKWYDFPVPAKFVKELLQARKISPQKSIAEYIDCRDRAPVHVQDIKKTVILAHDVNAEHRWQLAQSQWQARPFKPPCATELRFLSQFESRFRSEPGWDQLPAALALKGVTSRAGQCPPPPQAIQLPGVQRTDALGKNGASVSLVRHLLHARSERAELHHAKPARASGRTVACRRIRRGRLAPTGRAASALSVRPAAGDAVAIEL
jgi:hypothetical protein